MGVALRGGDRDKRHLPKRLIERDQIRNIQAPMQGTQTRRGSSSAQRKVKIIDMAVNQVEIRGFTEDLLHHQHMASNRILALGIETQSPGRQGYKPRGSY